MKVEDNIVSEIVIEGGGNFYISEKGILTGANHVSLESGILRITKKPSTHVTIMGNDSKYAGQTMSFTHGGVVISNKGNHATINGRYVNLLNLNLIEDDEPESKRSFQFIKLAVKCIRLHKNASLKIAGSQCDGFLTVLQQW